MMMDEILHHLGSKNVANNGVDYLLTGAGFLPSTVLIEFSLVSNKLFFQHDRTEVF